MDLAVRRADDSYTHWLSASFLYVAGEQNSAAAPVPRLRSREPRISRGSHDCAPRAPGVRSRIKCSKRGGAAGLRGGILCAASAQNGTAAAVAGTDTMLQLYCGNTKGSKRLFDNSF
jgi:hypothetical protein